MKSLITQNLIVRDFTLEDAPFVLEMLNGSSYLHYIRDNGVRSQADAEKYIEEKIFGNITKFGFGYHLVMLKDGTPIGQCGILQRPFLSEPDIGFAFLQNYQGMGYGFESMEAFLKSDEVKDFPILHAFTSLENPASQNLLRKLGFESQGIIKYDNTDDDVKLFTLRRQAE